MAESASVVEAAASVEEASAEVLSLGVLFSVVVSVPPLLQAKRLKTIRSVSVIAIILFITMFLS